MSVNHRTGLRVDLYDGYYGNTLRIATRSEKALLSLRAMFEALGGRDESTCVLSRDQGTHMKNCDALRLIVNELDTKPIEIEVNEAGTTVLWGQTSEEWRRACGLVDGLVDHGHGHQYLSEMEPNPIIVELSYRE